MPHLGQAHFICAVWGTSCSGILGTSATDAATEGRIRREGSRETHLQLDLDWAIGNARWPFPEADVIAFMRTLTRIADRRIGSLAKP